MRIALIDLPDRILAHASGRGISVAQFEQQIDWELQEFVDAPVTIVPEEEFDHARAWTEP